MAIISMIKYLFNIDKYRKIIMQYESIWMQNRYLIT